MSERPRSNAQNGTVITLRQNTAAAAADSNPTLASGEPGYETDTGKFKIGDGKTAWTDLPYATDISRLPASLRNASALASTYIVASGDSTGASDTADLSKALTAFAPFASPRVVLGPGNFYLSAQLLVEARNALICGSGMDQTIVYALSSIGTQEPIKMTGAGCGLRDLQIVATASNSSAVIHFTGSGARCERVSVVGPAGGSVGPTCGILGDATATDLQLRGCSATGIINPATKWQTGTGICVAGDDTLVEDCQVSDCGTTSYQQQGGLFITGATGVSGRRIRVRGGSFFNNATHGIYVSGCDNVAIDGAACYSNGAAATTSGNFGRGITISYGACVGAKVVNCELYSNQEDGIIVGGSNNGAASLVADAIISNNYAYGNNLGAFPGGHGIEVNATGATITGNTCCGNHNGISISGINITVTGNHCYGNTSTDATQGAGIHVNWGSGPAATVPNVTVNGTSATVASGGFPGIVAGMAVSGTNIAAGTVVQYVNGNTLMLSGAATGNTTETLTFSTAIIGVVVNANLCHHNDNNGIAWIGQGTYYGAMCANNVCVNNGLQNRAGARYDIYADSASRNGTFKDNYLNNTAGVMVSINDGSPNRGGNVTASDNGLYRTLAYGATVTWNGESATLGLLTVTNSSAFTIAVPTTSWPGREVTYIIQNNSGGALGTITWASGFDLAGAFVNPANGARRVIKFVYDGAAWREVSRTSADQ